MYYRAMMDVWVVDEEMSHFKVKKQGGFATYPQQTGYPPQQAGYPPQQAGYPPQQAGYPPQQAGYPPPQAGYPPQQAGYPPQQAGYPPEQQAYPGATAPPSYSDSVYGPNGDAPGIQVTQPVDGFGDSFSDKVIRLKFIRRNVTLVYTVTLANLFDFVRVRILIIDITE
ncbi:Glycine-rich protein A3 [Nymphon striatum]|nr:Glycine-rich protein A3 [Nymphon striatum]